MSWLVVTLSLGSAFGSAISTTLKKASASRAPSAQGSGAKGLGRFIAATATSPLWLSAVVADVLGVGLQVLALHYGPLALVQPLLISGLLFALLLRHGAHSRPTAAEALWGLAVAGSLIGFLVLSGAAATHQPAHADHSDAVAVAVAVTASVVVLIFMGHRNLPPAGRAAILGAAVGGIYATSAALIKASTVVLADHGLLALVTSWQLYATLAVAASGLVLGQITLQAGPLTTSLPAIATIDPLLSVLIGVVVYDERLHHGPGHGAVLVALLLLLAAAIVGLARVESALVTTEPRTPGVGTFRRRPR